MRAFQGWRYFAQNDIPPDLGSAAAGIAAMPEPLRRELRALDPANPVLLLQPMSDLVNGNLTIWLIRLLAAIFGIFGGVDVAVPGVVALQHVATRRGPDGRASGCGG